ncbi:hypothetical protein [Streptomyces sp. NPDC059513]|uniref:hypothetical protein n=1 Tax=unclassified Streptomyces TaxID=2593676 RepID=UPI0036A44478
MALVTYVDGIAMDGGTVYIQPHEYANFTDAAIDSAGEKLCEAFHALYPLSEVSYGKNWMSQLQGSEGPVVMYPAVEPE